MYYVNYSKQSKVQRILVKVTARKTVFPRSWNIMQSLKRPSKYYLYINVLVKKKTVFPVNEKFKTRTFSVAQSKNFLVISKYYLSINFLSQKEHTFHHWNVQNKNFSVIGKYHISINFLAQERPYLRSPKNSNQGLFSNQ